MRGDTVAIAACFAIRFVGVVDFGDMGDVRDEATRLTGVVLGDTACLWDGAALALPLPLPLPDPPEAAPPEPPREEAVTGRRRGGVRGEPPWSAVELDALRASAARVFLMRWNWRRISVAFWGGGARVVGSEERGILEQDRGSRGVISIFTILVRHVNGYVAFAVYCRSLALFVVMSVYAVHV